MERQIRKTTLSLLQRSLHQGRVKHKEYGIETTSRGETNGLGILNIYQKISEYYLHNNLVMTIGEDDKNRYVSFYKLQNSALTHKTIRYINDILAFNGLVYKVSLTKGVYTIHTPGHKNLLLDQLKWNFTINLPKPKQ